MVEGDIEALLDVFRRTAIKLGAAIAEGRTRAANRSTVGLEELYQALAGRNQEVALLSLLEDENRWVQVFAATMLAQCGEPKAMQTLRYIAAEGDPLPALEAKTAMLFRRGIGSGSGPSGDDLANENPPGNEHSTVIQEIDLPEALADVKQLLAKMDRLPRTVPFTDIQEVETMEDRFFAVDRTVGAILGMNVDSIDFYPDNEPPTDDEVLAWLWVIRPEYKAAILELGSDTVRRAVLESEED